MTDPTALLYRLETLEGVTRIQAQYLRQIMPKEMGALMADEVDTWIEHRRIAGLQNTPLIIWSKERPEIEVSAGIEADGSGVTMHLMCFRESPLFKDWNLRKVMGPDGETAYKLALEQLMTAKRKLLEAGVYTPAMLGQEDDDG